MPLRIKFAAADREKTVAVTNAEREREVAELDAERAELEALAIDRRSAAEALANRRKVAAGLTPQERAEWDYKIADVVSKNIAHGVAEANYPTVYSAGGGEGGETNVLDFLGYESALNIVDRMTEETTNN